MIDIKRAKKEFENYVEKYGEKDDRTNLKVSHIERTSKNAKKIAENLKLNKEEIELSELIGLLHDIGRFEQYKKFKEETKKNPTEVSKKFDHGEAGVNILKKEGYIRKYIIDDKYDEIIYKAIYEHNKYLLSKDLSEREKLFCKIVRDADKIDIIYEGVYKYWQDSERIKKVEEGRLSEEMLDEFYNKKLSNNKNSISETDQILRYASFIFDINFKCSFEMLKESNNIEKMIDRFNYKIEDTKEKMQIIKKIANEYINEKSN